MRKNFGAKPYILPQPVFIIAAYGEDGTPDAMTAVWGGISNEKEISICISSQRKTLKNILAHGAFTVSMADAAHVNACDYVGIESGNKVPNKFEKAGFHAMKSDFVDAPLIEELPMALECRVKSYDEKTWRMVGEIVNVSADESILDENGKVSPGKFNPIIFDWMNKDYLKIGEKVGNAFHDGLVLKR
jgi:flavin reductase (DIM6/NTAB) family NADH-FMN oxidoreductase RutF